MSTANESDVEECRPDSGLRRWLEVGLIFAVFFILAGAPAPHVNEAHYLAKAKHYWNPEWITGDMFLDSACAHQTFFWTIGWLTKWFSMTTVAWIGRLVAWFLLAIFWQQLSYRIVRAPFASVLTAALFVTMLAKNNFAGEWVVGGVEGKCFAYALVFAALGAVCASRWRTAWLLLGLASAFHVLVGAWSTISVFYIWLREPSSSRPRLATMLPSLICGGLLALFGVVPALQLTAGVSAEVADRANQIYVFDRLPHHLAPLSLPSDELIMKLLRFGKLLLSFVALWAALRIVLKEEENLDNQQAQTNALDNGNSLLHILRFGEASLLLCLIGTIWEVATWGSPALAAKLLKYYWFRLADVAIPLGVSFSITWFVWRFIRKQSKWGVLALSLALIYPGWHLINISIERWNYPAPPAERRMRNAAAWVEACHWVRDHTPQDALFLIPRTSNTFKWHTGRSDLITRKDIPQDAKSLLVWSDRYNDVFWYTDELGEKQLYRSLATQGTDRMKELTMKYNVDYLLTREYPPLDLPVAYSNESYTIYATSPTSQATLR